MEIQELVMKCELKLTVFSPDGEKKSPKELSYIINRAITSLNLIDMGDDVSYKIKVMPNTITEIIKLRLSKGDCVSQKPLGGPAWR